MISKENPRPGGRSARVQASVHRAVSDLLSQMNRGEITVPLVAQFAGVTPSTIYRRWGDLQELLGDVAVERLRPETEPAETGSARSDLEAWAEQYADEMSSVAGRQLLRDVLAAPDGSNAAKCCGFTREQLSYIVARARAAGEPFPDVDALMDYLISPIIYRILFADAPDAACVRDLVERLVTWRGAV